MPVVFDPEGAKPGQIGGTFDVALGYLDPDTELVKMIGYCVAPSGTSTEGTDITDDQHVVQISSPSSSDRFARFPQASQGDWSKGERQRVFITPDMYYLSDGNVDVSTPGNLRLYPGTTTRTITLTGTYNKTPLQTDGAQYFVGAKQSGSNFSVGIGSSFNNFNVAGGDEIFDLLYVPLGLAALTKTGIWFLNANGTSQHKVVDTIDFPWNATKSLAYLDDVVYYLKNQNSLDSQIKGYTRTGETTQTYLTANDNERFYSCICSTSSGIFFSTTSSLPFLSFFYIWDGVSADPERVADIYGHVEYAFEALGTTYILCRQFQQPYTSHPAWTLYSLVGNQVSIVDDARWITDTNFQPSCTSVLNWTDPSQNTKGDFAPMLWTDGRFLYIAWPGLATKRIDLVQGGISQIGPNLTSGQGPVSARRFVTSAASPYIDVSTYSNQCKITCWTEPATTGSITSSFLDFGAPGEGKIFRSVSFQTSQALTGTQAVAFEYRLDQNGAYTSLTTQKVGTRSYIAAFPHNTKGIEVQVRCTITADPSAGSPVVTAWSVAADLGRVETYTLSCRRNQQSRSQDQAPIDAQAYTGMQLQANLLNIRNIGGGYGYCYVPDPTVVGTPGDPTDPPGVAQIQIRLIDIERPSAQGAATGLRQVNGDLDMEGDVVISFSEFFPPQ